MAQDTRPFKSKEQDGQGNEIILRDQQLVEQGNATTMPSGACFETLDVDNRPVKIPRDNMMNIVLECIGIILNDSSKNLGTNVQKALGLQGNTIGHSTVADFASVLGVDLVKRGDFTFVNYVSSTMGGDGTVLGVIKYLCAKYTRRTETGTTFIVNMLLATQSVGIIHLYAGTLSDGKPQYGSGIYYTLSSWKAFSIQEYNYSETNL